MSGKSSQQEDAEARIAGEEKTIEREEEKEKEKARRKQLEMLRRSFGGGDAGGLGGNSSTSLLG